MPILNNEKMSERSSIELDIQDSPDTEEPLQISSAADQRKRQIRLKIREAIRQKYYPTYEQAKEAVQILGITTIKEYRQRHREDPRLYNDPDKSYEEFEGWPDFLRNETRKNTYETLAEARVAATALAKKHNVINWKSYKKAKLHKIDRRLPCNPEVYYEDFVSLDDYLGIQRVKREKRYETSEEAAEAIQRLGIKNLRVYAKRYKEDPRLPCNLLEFYKENFCGWDVIWGKAKPKPELEPAPQEEVVKEEPAKAEIKQPDEKKTYYADAIAAVERVRKAIAAELKAKSKKARKSNASTEASPKLS
jgi:hypothetical protein